MQRTTKYVALDVHQATTVAAVRAANGRVIARTILPTEEPAIVAFFRGMRGAVHVALEEGTQAQWLHDVLVPLVARVVVCDRRGERQHGNKADQVDADQLAERLRQGSLRAVYHGSPHRAVLQELTRSYANLVEDTTRVMLRLKALFRARGIPAVGKRVYHPTGRSEWLAQLPDAGARSRAAVLYAELDVLHQLRPPAKAAMLTEARRDPAWAVLRTIPFYGPVRVALLLATMRTPWRFRTKRNLWGYAGLAVVTEASAEYALVAGRPAGAPSPGPADPGAESESQPGLEGRVQRRGHRRHDAAGPAAGVVSGPAGRRHAAGAGAGDARSQTGGAHPARVEARRTI